MSSEAPSADPSLRHAFERARDADAGDAELAFHRARLADEGPTLVAMCGIGRLLVPLAAGGATVHGADASAAAIAVAQARLAERHCDALLVRQALDELNLAFRYRAAFLPDGALNRIVDPTRALEGLRRVAAHLVAPAALVVDLAVPAEARHAPGAPLVEMRTATAADGTRVGWRSETRVDVEGRRIDRIDRFEKREGRAIVARHDERVALTWYERDEIAPMLEIAGFANVEIETAPWIADGDAERWVAIATLA
ncbi:MAG TPA: methyltransferase domain-containing protein [Casimicrobiaceae bacterium]|jgi:hypothetical protein